MGVRVYRCEACGGCPLAAACLSRQSKGTRRTIRRDEYEPLRERTAARMATSQGREVYWKRPRIAETPFGILKHTERIAILNGMRKDGEDAGEVGPLTVFIDDAEIIGDGSGSIRDERQ